MNSISNGFGNGIGVAFAESENSGNINARHGFVGRSESRSLWIEQIVVGVL